MTGSAAGARVTPVQTNSSRRLVLMRHSKAEQTGPSDMARVLADRGVADAADVGRWLAAQGFVPDHALVSSADRTRQTWTAVAEAAGWDVEAEFDTSLYSAGPDAALDLLRLAPTEARSLLVIGHNPTMASLAHLIDSGHGDPVASAEMLGGYPTSAVTVFEYDGTWADLDVTSAAVVAFHVGRG
jgi:phosphohistidine phosphatase